MLARPKRLELPLSLNIAKTLGVNLTDKPFIDLHKDVFF